MSTSEDSAIAFARALRDEDWRVRADAVARVRQFAPREALVPVLVLALSDARDVAYRNAAAAALGLLGPSAVKPIAQALPTMDEDAKKLACEALAEIPLSDACELLRRLLQDSDSNVREAAAIGLGNARYAGQEMAIRAHEALLASLPDASIQVRLGALGACHALQIPLPAPVFQAYALDALLGPHACLAASGSSDPIVVERLVELATSSTGVFRASALRALAVSLERNTAAHGALARARDTFFDVLRALAEDANSETASSALVLLSTNVREEDAPLYLRALARDATADAARAGLERAATRMAPWLLARMRTEPSTEIVTEALGLVFARADSEASAHLCVSILDDKSVGCTEMGVALLEMLPSLTPHPMWERLLPFVHDDSALARRTSELLSRLATAEPEWTLRHVFPAARGAAACAIAEGLLRANVVPTDFASRALESVGAPRALEREWALRWVAAGGRLPVDVALSALSDEQVGVVVAAVRAVSAQGRTSEIEALATSTEEPRVLAACVGVLCSMREHDDAPCPSFVLTRVTKAEQRLAACVVASVPSSHSLFFDVCDLAQRRGDASLALLCVRRLDESKDARATARLLHLQGDERAEVRTLVASLLARRGERGALLERFFCETEPSVLRALRAALFVVP